MSPRELYEAMDSIASCPPWENLGDVTRSVWIERFQSSLYGALESGELLPPQPPAEIASQAVLGLAFSTLGDPDPPLEP